MFQHTKDPPNTWNIYIYGIYQSSWFSFLLWQLTLSKPTLWGKLIPTTSPSTSCPGHHLVLSSLRRFVWAAAQSHITAGTVCIGLLFHTSWRDRVTQIHVLQPQADTPPLQRDQGAKPITLESLCCHSYHASGRKHYTTAAAWLALRK